MYSPHAITRLGRAERKAILYTLATAALSALAGRSFVREGRGGRKEGTAERFKGREICRWGSGMGIEGWMDWG